MFGRSREGEGVAVLSLLEASGRRNRCRANLPADATGFLGVAPVAPILLSSEPPNGSDKRCFPTKEPGRTGVGNRG